MSSSSSSDFPIRLAPVVTTTAATAGIADAAADDESSLQRLLRQHPVPKYFKYGTAGFRDDAESGLDGVCLRVGAALASLASSPKPKSNNNRYRCLGVAVTASHNAERDNGLKLVQGPSGSMLDDDGQRFVVSVVNGGDEGIDNNGGVDGGCEEDDSAALLPDAVVHIGYDTRCHSPELVRLLLEGLRCQWRLLSNAVLSVFDHGIVTTPQLHFCVRHWSKQQQQQQQQNVLVEEQDEEDAFQPDVQGYYEMLATSYEQLLATATPTTTTTASTLVVDCACGVGYLHLSQLIERYPRVFGRRRDGGRIRPTNAPVPTRDTVSYSDSRLNNECGSEHVQKSQSPPKWYDDDDTAVASDIGNDNKSYCAALDGDADRIVFFRCAPTFKLWDGDKMACLVAMFVQEQLQALLSCPENDSAGSSPSTHNQFPLRLGVVQTAYANGASTAFLRQVLGKDNVLMAKTGVRHLHAVAERNFDIGVYFESNGHGTLLFGRRYYEFLKQQKRRAAAFTQSQRNAFERLRLLPNLVNQAVGDALSDLLLIDAILWLRNWTLNDWDALYTDLRSKQMKVRVDPQALSIVRTNDTETRCIEPAALQSELDDAMSRYDMARAFIRPSGTEPVVRVYAEAATQEDADRLADRAQELVEKYCCGDGPSSKM